MPEPVDADLLQTASFRAAPRASLGLKGHGAVAFKGSKGSRSQASGSLFCSLSYVWEGQVNRSVRSLGEDLRPRYLSCLCRKLERGPPGPSLPGNRAWLPPPGSGAPQGGPQLPWCCLPLETTGLDVRPELTFAMDLLLLTTEM